MKEVRLYLETQGVSVIIHTLKRLFHAQIFIRFFSDKAVLKHHIPDSESTVDTSGSTSAAATSHFPPLSLAACCPTSPLKVWSRAALCYCVILIFVFIVNTPCLFCLSDSGAVWWGSLPLHSPFPFFIVSFL